MHSTLRGLRQTGKSQGEAAYLRLRDAAVDSLTSNGAGEALPRHEGSLDIVSLSEAQIKEIKFNLAKADVAKIEAFLSGSLPKDDLTPELALQVQEHMKKLNKNQKDRIAEKTRKRKVCRAKALET
jgi:hypothetical protein